MYFDSHAHYDDESFNEDRENLIKGLEAQGVDLVVNVAADMKSCFTSLELAHQYDFIYSSVGVHPEDVKNLTDEDIETMKKLAADEKVVAVGEIGLDYHYDDNSPREDQRIWFEKQLLMAKELDLPVIIHSREASEETYQMIMKSGVKEGVIHCFSGSLELAQEYVKKGFYIGIGGALTFKNAKKLVRVAAGIDIHHILIETDCPYMTPVPHRGKRNDSSYLKYVVQKIALIKGMSDEEVAQITKENAKRLYRIK